MSKFTFDIKLHQTFWAAILTTDTPLLHEYPPLKFQGYKPSNTMELQDFEDYIKDQIIWSLSARIVTLGRCKEGVDACRKLLKTFGSMENIEIEFNIIKM